MGTYYVPYDKLKWPPKKCALRCTFVHSEHPAMCSEHEYNVMIRAKSDALLAACPEDPETRLYNAASRCIVAFFSFPTYYETFEIGMAYCSRCDRHFASLGALNAHKRDSSYHWVCWDCNKDFTSRRGLIQHYVQSPAHDYCQSCDEHFDDEDELTEHYREDHHYCESCEKIFKSDYGLQEHYRQSHYYCAPCKRIFNSESNLRSHMNSSLHRPKNVACPFRGCGQAFVSKSALVLHLESGYCPSGANRKIVDRYVRDMDRNNVITDPSRLLTAGNQDDVKTYATTASWNGHAYECYLCHSEFHNLRALNQHFESPRHRDKVYRCPLSSCDVHFSTLSALCQHVESERCGVSRFRPVQNAMEHIFSGMGRLTL